MRLRRRTLATGGVDAARFARERLGIELDSRQEELLRMEGRRVLVNCTRQWGKSTMAAAKAVHRAHSEKGSLTLVLSPSERQSGEFLRKARAFAGKLKVKPRGDGTNALSLMLPNGSRIVGLPGAEDSVRGFSAVSLMVIDEAARVSDALYCAARPMLAVGNGDLWLMSTPWGKRGFFWREWAEGEGWEKVSVTAEECGRIPKEFLREEEAALGERLYRQEYLCEFADCEGAVFTREVVERAFTDEVEPLKLE